MEFNNTVLYCKGFYQPRGGISKMWMDLAHCMYADGWFPQTKYDVAMLCLSMLDDFKKDQKFHYDYKLNLYEFFKSMDDTKFMYSSEEPDMYDLIIKTFKHIIVECDQYCFDEYLKPSPYVLPLNLSQAWYSKNDHKLYPAEMMCDYMENFNKVCPDAKEQNIDPNTFEYVESMLYIYDWKDVMVINGSDNLNDCIEMIVKGSELRNNMTDDGKTIDLNIYNNVRNFADNKMFTVRLKQDEYDIYKLMSVTA